jgi:hypothetical protein
MEDDSYNILFEEADSPLDDLTIIIPEELDIAQEQDDYSQPSELQDNDFSIVVFFDHSTMKVTRSTVIGLTYMKPLDTSTFVSKWVTFNKNTKSFIKSNVSLYFDFTDLSMTSNLLTFTLEQLDNSNNSDYKNIYIRLLNYVF